MSAQKLHSSKVSRTEQKHIGRSSRMQDALTQMLSDVSFYHDMVESMDTYAIFAMDMEGTIRSWNTGAKRLLGYTAKEIIGRNSSLFFLPEDRENRIPESERATAREKGRASVERWHIKKDGKTFWSIGYVFPLKNHENDIQGFIKVIRDLTEYKNIAVENDRLASIFEEAPAAICILQGKHHIIKAVNKASIRILGKRNILGKPLAEILPNMVDQGYITVLDNVYETGIPFVGNEVPVKVQLRKNVQPEERYFNFMYHPLRETDGQITGIFVHAVEITEQIYAKKALEKGREEIIKQEKQVRLITDAVTAFVAYIDKNRQFRFVNKRCREWLGKTQREIIGKNIKDVIDEKLYSDMNQFINRALVGERIVVDEYVLKGKRKSLCVDIDFIPDIHDSKDDKNIRGVIVVGHDITKRKEMEKNIEESAERLTLALKAGKIGVWDWNLRTHKIHWSERVYEINGVTSDTFQPSEKNLLSFVHPDDKKKVERLTRKALKDGSKCSYTVRVCNSDGEIKWIYTSAIVVRDNSGMNTRMIGAVVDVSERKKIEKNRSDFVSIVTHELRTPVTSIKAYAEVLERKFNQTGDTVSAMQLGKMNMQLNRLSNLITDLLDATKIEAGQFHMHEETFEFDSLVAEIVEEMQRTTELHELSIRGKTGKMISADRERIGQVLINLLSNAIKYSPDTRKVIVTTRSTSNHIQLCVRDFGMGIPDGKIPKLFERFYRVNNSKENAFPGLGLGLYISREIIKRLGGKIWAESVDGKGAKFCFTLPLTRTED